MQQTYILLILFFCHYLADYTHLSTNWMLSAKRIGKPLYPIFCHALVHGGLMWFALSVFGIESHLAVKLMWFQILTHFIIDVLKGKMNVWFPNVAIPANKFHWWLFGFDQFLHTIVIIFMSYWATTV